jgi:hypothetical protein
MLRLLKLLLLTTLLLPLLTGALAVSLGFGDPWGMGSKDPWGIFMTAALPFLVPGIYQIYVWPPTLGVAILLSPLVAVGKGKWYVGALLAYLAALATAWSFAWATKPDYLNLLSEGRSYNPGQLVSTVWKIGIYLLADCASAAAAIAWWRWRR